MTKQLLLEEPPVPLLAVALMATLSGDRAGRAGVKRDTCLGLQSFLISKFEDMRRQQHLRRVYLCLTLLKRLVESSESKRNALE